MAFAIAAEDAGRNGGRRLHGSRGPQERGDRIELAVKLNQLLGGFSGLRFGTSR